MPKARKSCSGKDLQQPDPTCVPNVCQDSRLAELLGQWEHLDDDGRARLLDHAREIIGGV